MKTVLGGAVTLRAGVHPEDTPYAEGAVVEKIEFPALAPAASVTAGNTGVLYTKDVAPVLVDLGEFVAGSILYYGDGNRNNDVRMTILSVVGPTKYNVVVM